MPARFCCHRYFFSRGFSALRRFIPNSADVLKNVPRRIVVTPVMPLSFFGIPVILLGGTPIVFPSAFTVRPSGFKNASSRIAPEADHAALTPVAQRINQQCECRRRVAGARVIQHNFTA